MKTYLRSASALLLASSLAGHLAHGATLPNRLGRGAAQTAPEPMAQGVSARVRSSTSLGHLSPDTRLGTLSLLLTPTAQQSAALDQLLADQQNPASPRFHQWLTPEQFGGQFGVSDSDLQVIEGWLASQGLQVLDVAPSRNRITFSGTSGAVEAAFHTELNNYTRGGQKFFENGTAPQLPAALNAVVAGITGLSSFRPEPQLRRVIADAGAGSTQGSRPGNGPGANYTSASGNHFITPYDFRQIYNGNALFNGGQTGTGVTIAVLGQSAIDLNQISNFQRLTGQTQKAPTLLLVPNTGVSTAYTGDQTESEADVEYASGVAPGATVVFVYAGSSVNADVSTALNYAITNKATVGAQILTYSYGGCETVNSISALQGQENLFRQANAQGQTILVASGDTGAAGCEDPGVTTAYDGLQVGYPASSPYVTAVGGTSFNDAGGSYWTTNNAQNGSAVGYIPESVWNENSTDPLAASGGGASRIFGKPGWQTGPGVPADGARDIPDISFSAAEHDAYVVCTSDPSFVSGNSNGACTTTSFGIARVGGTSLPTPAFAGALAMVLNANNNTTGLGNINPLLYSLATTRPGIFHDITTGNNNAPCVAGSIGCVNGTLGYSAAAGYDLATGLGSLDLGAFSGSISAGVPAVSRVPNVTATATGLSATAIQITVRVGSNGSTVPTGTVGVAIDGGTPQSVTLAGGAAVVTVNGTFAVGTHTAAITYGGDSNFAASTASLTLSVPSANGGIALTATPATITINSSTAHSGTWTLNLTSTNGYTGIVRVFTPTAATGSTLPATGCFLGQGDAGLSPNATVSTTITYSYSAADCSTANAIPVIGSSRPAVSARSAAPRQGSGVGAAGSTTHSLPLLAVGFSGLLGSAFLRRRRSWMTGLLALAAMAGTAGLSGCGSGSTPLPTNVTGGGGGTTVNAPRGIYNLVFTVSPFTNPSLSATTNVTLVIQ